MGGTNRRHFSIARHCSAIVPILLFIIQLAAASPMQSAANRDISGIVVDNKNEVLSGATVIVRGTSGERRAVTNDTGRFAINVPDEDVLLHVEGPYIKPQDQSLSADS